jgi:N-acetylglutamate synthase-like GNAT family acetyltransferase
MELKTSALTFCKANPEDYVSLLKLISKVLIDGDSLHAEKYDYEKWFWKYFLLHNAEPRIYICKENQEIIGYYHCPVYAGTINGVAKKFAMVQDVGMSETARGKGVFSQLAIYANDDLKEIGVNFIYTFPNDNSIHTFIKYNGYTKMQALSAFVLPVSFGVLIASKFRFLGIEKMVGKLLDFLYRFKTTKLKTDYTFKKEPKLNQQIIETFEAFGKRFNNSLTRSLSYLKWRYELKPQTKHHFFTASSNGKIVAAVIIGIDNLLGSNAAIILDFASTDDKAFTQLIMAIKKNSKHYFNLEVGLLFTATTKNNDALFLKSGFMKIPEGFNPRPLNLLGKNLTENETEVLNPDNWLVTLSEWDVL